MPNWCENSVTVHGENKNIKKFIDDFREKGFGGCLPLPEILLTKPKDSDDSKQRVAQCGVDNWYNWAISNWGTKWNVDLELAIIDTGRNVLVFDTAWSPPYEWIVYASKHYNITVEDIYEETSLPPEFTGKLVCSNGNVDKDISVDDFLNPDNVPILADIFGAEYILEHYEEMATVFKGEDIVDEIELCIQAIGGIR